MAPRTPRPAQPQENTRSSRSFEIPARSPDAIRAWARDALRAPAPLLGSPEDSVQRLALNAQKRRLRELFQIIEQAQHEAIQLTYAIEEQEALAAPIRRLDDNLLSQIFLVAVMTTHESNQSIQNCRDREYPLRSIMLVSRLWNSVARSTHLLWSYLDFTDNEKSTHSLRRLHLSLSFSADCPLTISFSQYAQRHEVSAELSYDLIRNAHRWRELHLEGGIDLLYDLALYGEGSLSSLNHLSLKASRGDARPSRLLWQDHSLGVTLPSLTSLRIERHSWRRLPVFHIPRVETAIFDHMRIHVAPFFNWASACSQTIRHLSFMSCEFQGEGDVTSESIPPNVQLPALEHLGWECKKLEGAGDILTCLLSAAHHLNSLRISPVWFSLSPPLLTSVLTLVVPIKPQHSTLTQPFPQFLSSFPFLECLELTGHDCNASAYMDVLCNPQVAPTLRFFSVHARFEPKALLQMSWARSLNNNDEFTSRQTGCRFTILTGSRDRAGSYLPTIRNGSWADLCAMFPELLEPSIKDHRHSM